MYYRRLYQKTFVEILKQETAGKQSLNALSVSEIITESTTYIYHSRSWVAFARRSQTLTALFTDGRCGGGDDAVSMPTAAAVSRRKNVNATVVNRFDSRSLRRS